MAALIVTAELAPADFAWLEGFAAAHYQPSTQPGARSPDDVPGLAALGGGKVKHAAGAHTRRGSAPRRPSPG